MAKGKHAASANKRRAEAAHEHIDRLTEQLLDAKARARQFESDHERLPVVEEALRVALAERDQAASPEVERLTELVGRLQQDLDAAQAKTKHISTLWERAVDRLHKTGDSRAQFLEELWELTLEDPEAEVPAMVENRAQARLGAVATRRIQRARYANRQAPPTGL